MGEAWWLPVAVLGPRSARWEELAAGQSRAEKQGLLWSLGQGSSWHPSHPDVSLWHPCAPPSHRTRSSPCPNVKHGDEWGDPGKCENGDACQYCHTRTEQQFHPEVGLGGGPHSLWGSKAEPTLTPSWKRDQSHRLPDQQCLKGPAP